MIRIFSLASVLCLQILIYAQSADEYFPQETGYAWRYNAFLLDSLNNSIDSLAFMEADSFAVVSDFQGRTANVVLTKRGTESIINILPYTDTSFYDMEGSEGWVYFKITGLDSLLTGLDSTLALTFLELLQSFQDWYSVYRFANNLNSMYEIFNYDTVITYNGTPLNMRFRMEGKRLQDENISTAIGSFSCKKFLISSKIIYLFLGVIPITIVDMGDTSWIAPGHWMVKRFTPSSNVDLSFAGMPSFYIPGTRYDIALPPVTGIAAVPVPSEFKLYGNYPNPFNPGTRIKYRLGETAFTTLIVYDILGNEIQTLAAEEQAPGEYEIFFNAANLAGGIYYFRLTSGHNSDTRKMLLLK